MTPPRRTADTPTPRTGGRNPVTVASQVGGRVQAEASPREVFVVHGRNSSARKFVFEFLRALDLRPLEWDEVASSTGNAAPYIFDVLEMGFERAQAVVIIFTPDEQVELLPEFQTEPSDIGRRYQPRPNVFFEAGMAFMRDRQRTILIEFGSIAQASDLSGIQFLRAKHDDSVGFRNAFARRLRVAGCAVSTEGTDWLNAGEFSAAFNAASSKKRAGVEGYPSGTQEGEILHYERAIDMWASIDDDVDKDTGGIAFAVENRSASPITMLSCKCRVREHDGAGGDRAKGQILTELETGWLNWEGEIVAGPLATLKSHEIVRLPLFGVRPKSVSQKASLVLFRAPGQASTLTGPVGAISFEYVVSSQVGQHFSVSVVPRRIDNGTIFVDIDSRLEQLKLIKANKDS
jgi:predicted nucleotide-binding protein